MHKKYSLLFILSVLIISCKGEGIDKPVSDTVSRTYSAVIAEQTKTVYTEEKTVLWSEGDRIQYYSKKNGSIGSVTVPETGKTATLTVSIGTSDTFLVAAYGGSSITDNTGKGFTMDGAVEAVQSGLFSDAHVSVVKTYDMAGDSSLEFRNVTSLIKFTLERDDVSYVVFSSLGGEKINGDGTLVFTFNEEAPSVSFGNGGGPYIRINTDGAGTFYLSTLPVTLQSGFSITCYGSDDSVLGSVEYSSPFTIGTNEIVNLGVLDNRVSITYVDLSETGTSNCYVVPEYGCYKFNASVKGSSSIPLDANPGVAAVLWESYGTSGMLSPGDVVKDVFLKDGYIHFRASGRDGNAIIAVKDRDDELLWSWHIWVSKGFYPSLSALHPSNDAGTMMDRNLGAITNDYGTDGVLGLLYQWGRKDPFPGCSLSGTVSETSEELPPPALTSSTVGTIEYSVSYPTTFIKASSEGGSWLYMDDASLWQEQKTIYDPCPPGWRVPSGGPSGVFSTSLSFSGINENGVWLPESKGMNLGAVWYPAAGYVNELGLMIGCGSTGAYWSCTSLPGPYALLFNSSGMVAPAHTELGSAAACPVRCISEGSPSITAPEGITMSRDVTATAVGGTCYLAATIQPANANVDRIDWSSTDETVATVSSDGKICGVREGECDITASTYNGLSVSCHVIVAALDDNANCHIVPPQGYKAFDAVKGVGNEMISGASEISVLWESFGTRTKPQTGDIVSGVWLIDDRIYVKAGEYDGNALVALTNTSGTILWSWHIWVTSADLDGLAQVYYNDAGKVMDRNLGATSATPGDVRTEGLMYQWGRKDPFLGGGGKSDGGKAASTLSWPASVSAGAGKNVQYAVSHPTTFIKGVASQYWWNYDDSFRLWYSVKTDYDPCPPGWRVPDGGENGLWAVAHGSLSWMVLPSFDYSKYGYNYGGDLGSDEIIWYPGAGYIDEEDGTVRGDLNSAFYWSCTQKSNTSAYYFSRDRVLYDKPEAAGLQVRCMAQ